MRYAALSIILLAVAACGQKTGGAKAVLPDVPFDELDHGQRLQLMKQVVMPTMAPLFQEHNPQKFAKFSCMTCHGESVDRGEYHMPNDKLPKLNFSDMSKFDTRDIAFMKSKVVPTMARILKQPEHSTENPEGFGCLECHTRAAATAP